jgi:hypothetical protein
MVPLGRVEPLLVRVMLLTVWVEPLLVRVMLLPERVEPLPERPGGGLDRVPQLTAGDEHARVLHGRSEEAIRSGLASDPGHRGNGGTPGRRRRQRRA